MRENVAAVRSGNVQRRSRIARCERKKDRARALRRHVCKSAQVIRHKCTVHITPFAKHKSASTYLM
jgi:hypothetical protein